MPDPSAREIAINEDALSSSRRRLAYDNGEIKSDVYLCAAIDGNSQSVRY